MAMQTPIGEMRLDGRVIVHTIDSEATPSPEDALEVQRITAELAGGEPVAVLVDMRKMAFANSEVQGMFKDDPSGLEVATALLVETPASAASATLFERYRRPERDVKIFNNEAEALAWARNQIANSDPASP